MPPRTRNTSDIAMLTQSTIRNPRPRIVRIRATIDSGGLLSDVPSASFGAALPA